MELRNDTSHKYYARFLCRDKQVDETAAVPAIVESRDGFVVESALAWKLGFGHGRTCPTCALSAEPVFRARCPRGDLSALSARQESNFTGQSATARTVRNLFQPLRAERSCYLSVTARAHRARYAPAHRAPCLRHWRASECHAWPPGPARRQQQSSLSSVASHWLQALSLGDCRSCQVATQSRPHRDCLAGRAGRRAIQ
jgi:hypothetical protein